MKKIKLSGREISVLRAIDFSIGTEGAEIIERTHLEVDDFTDLISGLMDAGYVETNPACERVTVEVVSETMFEVNPSYAFDLREAIARR